MKALCRAILISALTIMLTPLSLLANSNMSAKLITIRPLSERSDATVAPMRSRIGAFDLGRIDTGLCGEFEKAWRVSSNGTTGEEGVVLVFRLTTGGYEGRVLGATRERLKFTFKWVPNAIAIVHTHPNNRPPEPSEEDELVAIKYGVPIFTLTLSGMYVFDPFLRQTYKVMDGLDWLDRSRFPEMPFGNSESSRLADEIQ